MADLGRLYDFVEDDVIRSAEVDAEFNQLVARSNVHNAAIGSATAPLTSVYRTLLTASQVERNQGAFGAGTYPLGTGEALEDASPTDLLAAVVGGLPVKYFAAADYAVSGLTTKLRVRAQVLSNAIAPGITLTFGVYPVTFSGAVGVLSATLGTVVAGTTVAIASGGAPAASTDATIPADGLYCLGVSVPGGPAASHAALLSAELQVRNV